MAGRRPDDGSITIGQIVGPHGIQGGVRVKALTEFAERFDKGRQVYINGVAHTIRRTMWHKDQVRLDLDGVQGRDAAEALKWAFLTVPADDLPELEEEEFLTSDLIGLEVSTVDGKPLGQVTDVLPNPAHDILVIGELLIPAVHEFVKDIDLDAGTVTVELIEGMLEDAE